MTARESFLCLTCNRAMVIRRCITNCEGQPDIAVWGACNAPTSR